jgi:hypothetical protein
LFKQACTNLATVITSFDFRQPFDLTKIGTMMWFPKKWAKTYQMISMLILTFYNLFQSLELFRPVLFSLKNLVSHDLALN